MKRLMMAAVLAVFAVLAAAQPARKPAVEITQKDNVFTREDSVAFAAAEWNWKRSGKGAKAVETGFAQIRMGGGVQSVSVARYKACKHRTGILCSIGDDAAATSKLASGAGSVAAINAGYFNVKTLGHNTYVKDGGQKVGVVNPSEFFRCNGMLMFSRNGRKMDIASCDSSTYDAVASGWPEAMVSGPVLVEDGRLFKYAAERMFTTDESKARAAEEGLLLVPAKPWTSFYGKRHPRTAIGYDAAGNIIMVVIDGRFPGEADGASVNETAQIMKWLGCVEAINMDGGGSSTVWTAGEGVLNHPFDNHKFDHEGERKVPSVIIAK